MTDTQRGLLNAIIADPDDDAPRLIYADWLDENAGEVECTKCGGSGHGLDSSGERTVQWCEHCNGTGRVSNGFAERAENIRLCIAKQIKCVIIIDNENNNLQTNCQFCGLPCRG